MKLLLDEMLQHVVAEQLRARGHDVVSVHDPEYRRLEGAPDEESFAAALDEERALVTENVPDFRRLEAASLVASRRRPSSSPRTGSSRVGSRPRSAGSSNRFTHFSPRIRHSPARSSSSARYRDDYKY